MTTQAPQKRQLKKRRYRPGSRKGVGNPNPKPPPVSGQIKKGEVRNPGGRPRLLSDAYREWLGEEDRNGVTNARKVAARQGEKALDGDTKAAHEFRQATEGERVRTWEDDVIELLRQRKITPRQLQQELPEDAPRLIIAAGLSPDEGSEVKEPGGGDSGTNEQPPTTAPA